MRPTGLACLVLLLGGCDLVLPVDTDDTQCIYECTVDGCTTDIELSDAPETMSDCEILASDHGCTSWEWEEVCD